MPKQILINLPVKDMNASKDFFAKLGFAVQPELTDGQATTFVILDNAFVGLLPYEGFKAATHGEVADTSKGSESLVALAMDSKDDVDEMVTKATEAGATEFHEPIDLGSMYGRSFEDLNGHKWNVFYMEVGGE